MTVSRRLRSGSRVMFVLCLLLAASVPIAAILPWLLPQHFPYYWDAYAALSPQREALTADQRLLGIGVSLLPAGLTSWALWRLATIFTEFASDRAFSHEAVVGFHRFSRLILLVTLATPLVETIRGVIYTWNNGPGERVIAFTFVAQDARDILFALLLLSLAYMFRYAHNLAEEQAHFL